MTTEGLPRGWTLSPIRDLVEFVTSGSRGWAAHYSDGGARFLRVGNLNRCTVDLDLRDLQHVQPPPGAEGERTRVQPGDILISITADVGMVAVVPDGFPEAFVNQHVALLRPRPSTYSRGLAYSLLNPSGFQRATRGAQYGATKPALNLSQVRDFEVALPPVPEQRRIVAAIDSHFSRLDAATKTLERVQRNLERYRASVLKAAVEGRLVPTEAELAKKEGRSYEPASVLLKRILAERRRRWEEAELAKLKAKGKPPTDDRWKTKYEEPAAPDTDGQPELPEGWCWATAASLYWDAGYGTSGKCTPEAIGPPVLRIPNVQDQALNLSDLKFSVDPGTLSPDGAVEPGDFLFIRTNGSVNLIGRGAVIIDPPPREYFFASYLIRLRIARVEHLCRWFAFAWHTSVVRDQLVRDAASSAGQHNVSLSAASKYLVPLPPAREQERVLAEIDRLETGRARTVSDTQLGRARIVRLRQSILKWAFEGRLVAPSAGHDETRRLP